jgi:hypothetical protein
MDENEPNCSAAVVAILGVMKGVGAIGKDQRNENQSYNFRGIDDIYNSFQPHLIENELVILPAVLEDKRAEYETGGGKMMQLCQVRVKYTLMHSSGSCVHVTVMGEGGDTADKAFNKAMTSAYKTMIFETFCTPTGEKTDSEFGNPEPQKKGTQKRSPMGGREGFAA